MNLIGFLKMPLADTLPGVSALLLFCASSAAIAGPQPYKSQSQASNNESEWWGTSSGWVRDSIIVFNDVLQRFVVPQGTWKEDYKHWFGVGGEPANFTNFQTIPKTPANMWGVSPPIDDEYASTSAGGSTATSQWYIRTGISTVVDKRGAELRVPSADYYTKSYANAKSGSDDQLANSRTRIRDPWIFQSPKTDPNWDPSFPIDPTGKWTAGGQVALFGSVESGGKLNWSYSMAFNSEDESSAVPLLDITIDGEKTVVTPNSSLVADNKLFFTDLNHNLLSAGDLETELDSSRTSDGWAINPGFDIKTFDPLDPSQLNEVFAFDILVNLDDSVNSAALFTDEGAFAAAIVSEPQGLDLILVGLLPLWAARRSIRAG